MARLAQPLPDNSPWLAQVKRRACSSGCTPVTAFCSPVRQSRRNVRGEAGLDAPHVKSDSNRRIVSTFCSPARQRRRRDWRDSPGDAARDHSDDFVAGLGSQRWATRRQGAGPVPKISWGVAVLTSCEDGLQDDTSVGSTAAPSSESSSLNSSGCFSQQAPAQPSTAAHSPLAAAGLSALVAHALASPRASPAESSVSSVASPSRRRRRHAVELDKEFQDLLSASGSSHAGKGAESCAVDEDAFPTEPAMLSRRKRTCVAPPIMVPPLPGQAVPPSLSPPPISPHMTPSQRLAREAVAQYDKNALELSKEESGSAARILQTFGKSAERLQRKIKNLDGMRKLLYTT